MMIKYARFVFGFCFVSAFSQEVTWPKENDEEALFIHRIASFWSEGEYKIAKTQIQDFLNTYPKSHFKDSLLAALGDLFLKEKNHTAALETYAQIASPDTLIRIFLNQAQCLYQLEWYSTLAEKCETFLKHETINPEDTIHATYYLAISLYQQCLNAPKNSEFLTNLATKAYPYFETLSQTNLHDTIATPFAYICACLQDFSKAAEIYTDLAKKHPEEEENFTYEKALLQSEYNKELALQTFESLIQKNGSKSQDAAYNALVLLFELTKYDEIIAKKDEFLALISSQNLPNAHLLIGRSFIAKEKYIEASQELQNYLSNTSISDTFHATLLALLNASFQASDLLSFHRTLQQLEQYYPYDTELSKAKFCLALLLKKEGHLETAKQKISEILSSSCNTITQSLRAEILLELIFLEYETKHLENTRNNSLVFMKEFPSHPLVSDVWDYLLFSSRSLASEQNKKEDLINDLQLLLSQEGTCNTKKNHWTLLQAETLFNLQRYENAISILENLITSKQATIQEEANAHALLGLCYKKFNKNLAEFCQHTEEAIKEKTTLFNLGALHASLYNAYLELSQETPEFINKANQHLLLAFENKAPLSRENQIYLAHFLFHECTQNSREQIQNQAIGIFEKIISENPSLTDGSCPIQLSQLYTLSKRPEDAIDLLVKYQNNRWNEDEQNTISFLLGENYTLIGKTQQALDQFQSLAKDSSFLKTKLGASAILKSAQILIDQWTKSQFPSLQDPAFVNILCQLKDVTLQKNIQNEPLHLEAALYYIDLQTLNPSEPEKELHLLTHMKQFFENKEDILSKDYHLAREKFRENNDIYQLYMQFLDAEILFHQSAHLDINEQKELQAKAKKILLSIQQETPGKELSMRVQKALSRYETIDL